MTATGRTLALAALLVLLAVVPPAARLLEAHLYTHVFGQYPLLIAAGVLCGRLLARRLSAPALAAPALLCAVLALAFWLLPRWIDASLEEPLAIVLKPVSLVALCGIPLGWGWALAGPVLRGFLVANAISMFGVMGWLQLAAPQRFCNAYLDIDQLILGRGFLLLSALLLAVALIQLLLPADAARRPPPAG